MLGLTREIVAAAKQHQRCQVQAGLGSIVDTLDEVATSRVEADLSRPGLPRDKVLAAVVRLLEATLIRVGNEEYAKENRSYGLTTMRDRHVEVDGSAVRFTFVSKGGRRRMVDLQDARLAKIVKRCRELPGADLFQYLDDDGEVRNVGSEDVNDYLRELTDQEFTAKERAEVQAQEFFGRAAVIKFDEAKQLVIFEGGDGALAELYRVVEKGRPPEATKAEKITYNRLTQQINVERAREGLQLRGHEPAVACLTPGWGSAAAALIAPCASVKEES